MLNRNRQNGFTLLEMMMVLAVVTVFSALAWAAFGPASHQYSPRNTANSIAAAVQTARMRAVTSSLCHELVIVAGTSDWAKTNVSVPAGGWMIAQANMPWCPSDGTVAKFGPETVLADYSGYSGTVGSWDNPGGMINIGMQMPKPAAQADRPDDFSVVYGVKCCNKDGGTCAAPTSSLATAAGNPYPIAFLTYPDGRIRIVTDSNYSGCDGNSNRFTIYVGTQRTFNNNYKIVQDDSGAEAGAANTSLQYSVYIEGNTGKVKVVNGW